MWKLHLYVAKPKITFLERRGNGRKEGLIYFQFFLPKGWFPSRNLNCNFSAQCRQKLYLYFFFAQWDAFLLRRSLFIIYYSCIYFRVRRKNRPQICIRGLLTLHTISHETSDEIKASHIFKCDFKSTRIW